MNLIKLAAMFGNTKEQFMQVDNIEQISDLINSKSSTTWGQSRYPDTDWVKLAQYSPNTENDSTLIIVCKLDDYNKALDLLQEMQ